MRIGIVEVTCFDCNKHMGWQIYTGPTGTFMCDDCAETYSRERDEESAETE